MSDAAAGQAVYTKKVLSIYDLWVLGFSNRYLWKCPTPLIGQRFERHATDNHLDVGVGTGYYLRNHLSPGCKRLGLVDLNQNSLDVASAAVGGITPQAYQRNVLEPLKLGGQKYDSISVNYLLHCLPGNIADKEVVFANLKEELAEGGILFGSTILGKGTKRNGFADKLMRLYNKKGIFSNLDDDLAALESALKKHFSQVSVEMYGCVALFSAVKA